MTTHEPTMHPRLLNVPASLPAAAVGAAAPVNAVADDPWAALPETASPLLAAPAPPSGASAPNRTAAVAAADRPRRWSRARPDGPVESQPDRLPQYGAASMPMPVAVPARIEFGGRRHVLHTVLAVACFAGAMSLGAWLRSDQHNPVLGAIVVALGGVVAGMLWLSGR